MHPRRSKSDLPGGFRGLGFALLLLIAYAAAHYGWLEFIGDQARVASYLKSHGPEGLVVIFLAGALFTGIGAPRQLLAFVFGFAMGGIQGAVISTLATAIGASGCFFAARWLLRSSLVQRFGHRMRRFDELFRERTLLKILMVRLLPVGSNLVTNLIAGCSGIGFLPFLAGSTLGYLPQMLIFALAGAGIGRADSHQVAVSVFLFMLAFAIGAFLYQKERNQTLVQAVSDPI
jgi:uncharacterized membrane protein YdjX (TVP38/TMEM64 family)